MAGDAYSCAPRIWRAEEGPPDASSGNQREASMIFRSLVSAAVFAAGVSCAWASDISGAGATFPFPIYAKWADV